MVLFIFVFIEKDEKKKDKPTIYHHHEEAVKQRENLSLKSAQRHHRKHQDLAFSSRDKDAGEVPEEIMRTLNFPSMFCGGVYMFHLGGCACGGVYMF